MWKTIWRVLWKVVNFFLHLEVPMIDWIFNSDWDEGGDLRRFPECWSFYLFPEVALSISFFSTSRPHL